jgi:hypothetical protein
MSQDQDPEDINRYEIGMDILARIQAEMGYDNSIKQRDPFIPDQGLNEYQPEFAVSNQFNLPDIQTLIESLNPLPADALLIGCCEDGLPVLYELSNPQPGSILILGGSGCGKSALLRSIITSITLTNSPRKVRYACISTGPKELDFLEKLAHCYKSATTYQTEASQIIRELAEIANQRAYGRQLGAVLLLVIDDLVSLVESLDEESFYLLLWLIQNGPSSQIITIATLDAGCTGKIDPNLYDYFGTFLIGQIDTGYLSNIPERLHSAHPELLIAKTQFSVFFDNDWVKFWIPRV